MNSHFLKRLSFIGILLAFAACAQAQPVPGPHPAYNHALTDLRTARDLLDHNERPDVESLALQARNELNAAIGELKVAAADDGKNPYARTNIDAGIPPQGRFHQALALIDKAAHDVSSFDDVPQASAHRDHAMAHLARAHDIVEGAIHSVRW